MDRRRYLAAAGVGLLGSVAGCTSDSGSGTQGNTDGPDEATATSPKQGTTIRNGQTGSNVTQQTPASNETVDQKKRLYASSIPRFLDI